MIKYQAFFLKNHQLIDLTLVFGVYSYKVAEVSMMSADRITFQQTLADGSKVQMSIPQYYEKAYGLRLHYPFLPCLGVKGRESTLYFPAEVCVIEPGKRFTKRVSQDFYFLCVCVWRDAVVPVTHVVISAPLK